MTSPTFFLGTVITLVVPLLVFLQYSSFSPTRNDVLPTSFLQVKDEILPDRTGHELLVVAKSRSLAYSRSPEFQIKTVQDNTDYCLETQTGPLVMAKCSDNKTQKWRIDELGRFRSRSDDKLCLVKKGVSKKCSLSTRFYFNAFQDTINFAKNARKILIADDNNDRVYIGNGDHMDMKTIWSIDPPIFQTKKDLPPNKFQIKSKKSLLCVKASSLKRGSTITLGECDASKSTQVWKVHDGSVLTLANAGTQNCIVKGRNGRLKLGRLSARISKNRVFIFDGISSAIIHTRSGNQAFTAINGTVELMYRNPQKEIEEMQQWSLEAV